MSLLELQGYDPDVVAHSGSHKGSGLSAAVCGHRASSISLTVCGSFHL